MIGFGNREGDMVQARSRSMSEHHVVRISFALQERKRRHVRAILGDVFGEAETHVHVEPHRVRYTRRGTLEMVEPLRTGPNEL